MSVKIKNEDESPWHTLLVCKKYKSMRKKFGIVNKDDLTLSNDDRETGEGG